MHFGRIFVIVAAVTLCARGPVSAEEAPKWGAHVDVEGLLGTERSLGVIDFFVPLAQSNRTLLFGDIRMRADEEGSHEGNFGLGVRHMLASGWNVGAYGFFDHSRSDLDSYFSQATLGIEALGRDFDLRANAYLPVGERVQDLGSIAGGSFASIVGSAIEVTTLGAILHQERALQGFDAEIGWRVPLWSVEDNKALRLYAGMFRFDDSVVEAVTGPRLRAELTMYEVPYLPEDSRLTLGAEYQDDNLRGSQGFAMARLRIPLQSERSDRRPLNWQERRMTDFVVRDIDIVTEAHTVQAPNIVETATQTADGRDIAVVDGATTPGADLQTAVTNAGAGSLVILTGTFNTTTTTTLQAGQAMMGAGSVTVRSASGHTAVLNTSAATINASTASTGIAAVTMANDSALLGMTINQTQNPADSDPHGVVVDNLTNVVIANNVITVDSSNGSAFGTYITNSSNVTVTGNTISATRPGAVAIGLYANSSSLMVADNTLSAFGNIAYAAYLVADPGKTLTILPGSTGNVLAAGGCDHVGSGTFTGAFSYSSGGTTGTCP